MKTDSKNKSINPSSTEKSNDKFYLDKITVAIGNTPLIKLQRLPQEYGVKATVLVKPEFINPTGSVKDRMAVYLLNEAVRKGDLKPGGTIVEGTSGNTGAAVAMYAAANGYKAILTIPDKMSDEKINTLKAFGAEVHICKTAVLPDSPESYYSVARKIHEDTPNSFFISQYTNLDNIEAHYRTTGPEIWKQTGGNFDVLVGGIGTGGTVSGIGRFIKEMNPDIEVVAVDPIGSVFYDYFKDKTMIEPQTYLVEGIGDDFLCPALDFSVIDKIYQVSDKECFLATRALTRKEGIFGGGSSGGAVHAALIHAKNLDADKTVVVILPDHGAKYLSKIFNDDWMREKGFID
ncbi:MAG: cysteine synthase family protein [bacterium]